MIFRKRKRPHKTINLALQGGGAFGAITWGVLDRLLEDPRITIEGVSGTSSGAMNAVAMAQGLISGGREAARATLAQFWIDIAQEVPNSLHQKHPLAEWHENLGINAFPALKYVDMTRLWSPYQMNPFGLNPVRDVLLRLIDFERLRATKHPHLFISATNVHTGKIRIFTNAEITIESLLASAPEHQGLLFAAASGFTKYSYAYVQQRADLLEDRDLAAATAERGRARRLYLRARDYGLRDQIQRAAVSAMANIAEGFDCDSNVEFGRFLGIARRSTVEVQSLLYTALDIGYIDEDTFKSSYAQAETTKALIGGLKSSLKKRSVGK